MTTPPLPQLPGAPAAADLSDAEINRRVLARARAMTPRQIVQLSVACGVHRADGSLAPEYGGTPGPASAG
jgi:hypothetical protein